ncbi:L,D-transpeptidase [Pontiella sp.]|uniref:L,D-transpeptidase n=1 Tax=Pontiella sp. TaxID=2837462 RepID=UPI00356A0EDD
MNIKSIIALSSLLLLLVGCTTQEKASPVLEANYSIVVSKSSNQLTLLQGNNEIKTYTVATGKNGRTPVTTFTIIDKLKNPPWTDFTGKHFESGEEGNILGSRYMMLTSSEKPQLRGFGIQGTNKPDDIGKQTTRGCISMFNEDIEELFELVPEGTIVTVID